MKIKGNIEMGNEKVNIEKEVASLAQELRANFYRKSTITLDTKGGLALIQLLQRSLRSVENTIPDYAKDAIGLIDGLRENLFRGMPHCQAAIDNGFKVENLLYTEGYICDICGRDDVQVKAAGEDWSTDDLCSHCDDLLGNDNYGGEISSG